MQRTATIVCSIAALASAAAAQVPNMVIDLRFPLPTEPPQQQLVPRDVLRMPNTHTTPVESLLQCASTLMSVVSVMPTPPPALQSWALHGARLEQVKEPCSPTMPASLSSDYVDYSSKAISWVLAVSTVVDQVKAKCTEASGKIPMAFAMRCTTQPTVFWVEADGKTRAEEQSLPTQLVPGVTSAPQSAPTSRGAATSTTSSGSAAATGSGSAATTGQTSSTTGATSAASGLRSAGLGMLIGAVACAMLL
ncbi:hypothetical protein MAPG_06056 [Magnaporthiopsis poae ATCC 64411]|uniref:Infection structure specific protein n=1 Tax=Magnaporthiopsis poae (strain ATCC 64411 / 73-15) TaxID=644358 RepID=A0A0C4E113_MAGP6|nr:hypothetical protein MAPG_06056 [Magnaporthiopsis poae ATCC 64411]